MKKRINDSIFSKYIFLGIIVIILVFTLINLKSYTGNPIVVNNNPISLCGISDVSGPTPTQPSGIQAPSTAQAAPAPTQPTATAPALQEEITSFCEQAATTCNPCNTDVNFPATESPRTVFTRLCGERYVDNFCRSPTCTAPQAIASSDLSSRAYSTCGVRSEYGRPSRCTGACGTSSTFSNPGGRPVTLNIPGYCGGADCTCHAYQIGQTIPG